MTDATTLHTLRRRLWSDEDWYAMDAFTGASVGRRGIAYRYDEDGDLVYRRVGWDGESCLSGEIDIASDVATELAEALRYRDAVLKALPVDDEADRMVDRMMAEHHRRQGPGRKLVRK